MNYEIIPDVGFEDVKIGMSDKELIAALGMPDEIEMLDDDEFFEDEHQAIWHYYEHNIYPVVDLDEKEVVSIMCDHPDLSFKKVKVLNMKPASLIKHLKDCGIKEIEEDPGVCIECIAEGINFVYEGEDMDLVDICAPM